MIRHIVVIAIALFSWAALTDAADAAPKGNDNWFTFEGTCDGHLVQALDPLGGSTAFLIDGSLPANNAGLLVGKAYKMTNLETGEVLFEFTLGRGVSEDRLLHCSFIFLEDPQGEVDFPFLLEVDILIPSQKP